MQSRVLTESVSSMSSAQIAHSIPAFTIKSSLTRSKAEKKVLEMLESSLSFFLSSMFKVLTLI